MCWLEHNKIMMMCGVRLADKVSTDVLHDRVGVDVKFKDMVIQSCLQWYGQVIHGDINSQIRKVVEVEITGEKEEGSTKEIVERVLKEGFGMIWLEKRGCV